jgi:hypothetical protein
VQRTTTRCWGMILAGCGVSQRPWARPRSPWQQAPATLSCAWLGAGQLGARLALGEHLFMVVAQRGCSSVVSRRCMACLARSSFLATRAGHSRANWPRSREMSARDHVLPAGPLHHLGGREVTHQSARAADIPVGILLAVLSLAAMTALAIAKQRVGKPCPWWPTPRRRGASPTSH